MILKVKRGLSPVIATILLVSVAMVLAVIIFLWARSFIEEAITKDGIDIEIICEDVVFVAEVYDGQLFIQNNGAVAIYGVEIRVQGTGEIRQVEETSEGVTISAGQTMNFTLPEGIILGDTVIAVPILLGESDQVNERVPHICDVDYGVQAVVGA